MDNFPQLGTHKINNDNHMTSRASSRGDLMVKGKTELRQSAFVNDAAKIWNNAPNSIKQSKSLSGAKREIKKFKARKDEPGELFCRMHITLNLRT